MSERTELRRHRLNQTYLLLKHGTTKEEVAKTLGLSDTRTARDLIAEVAWSFPVIATSDRKGYMLLPPKSKCTAEQIRQYEEMCRHAKNEHLKRSNEIRKRISPLDEWERS